MTEFLYITVICLLTFMLGVVVTSNELKKDVINNCVLQNEITINEYTFTCGLKKDENYNSRK